MWYSERRRGRRSSDSIGLACGPGTEIAVRADAAYRPYNIWRQQVKTTDLKHFGNSEVRWVDNLLYLYTQPFDVVAVLRDLVDVAEGLDLHALFTPSSNEGLF